MGVGFPYPKEVGSIRPLRRQERISLIVPFSFYLHSFLKVKNNTRAVA
jgi:hypothetical protein